MNVIYFLIFSLIFLSYTFTNFTVGYFYLATPDRHYALTAPLKSGQDFTAELTADSYLAIDKQTKKELVAKAADEVRPIASLTKLMTDQIIVDQLSDWQQRVTLETSDFRQGGSFYLRNGEQLSTDDLFHLSLIASDNVATLALVRQTGLTESEFVSLMNQRARLLGLEKTVFIEPTGVDPQNQSTARELMIIASQAFAKKKIQEITNLNNYYIKVNEGEQRLIRNTNLLLADQGVKALRGKTGYIPEAGYCLASELAANDSNSFYVVVLGSDYDEGRFVETKEIADWTRDNFIFYN